MPSPKPRLRSRLLAFAAALLLPAVSAFAAFGLSSTTDFYTVDTGAGLVFKVRRTNNGSSTQSAGDIGRFPWCSRAISATSSSGSPLKWRTRRP